MKEDDALKGCSLMCTETSGLFEGRCLTFLYLIIVSVGLSVLECRPFGEQRNSSPSVSVRKPRSYSSLIVPMLKGSDQERMR